MLAIFVNVILPVFLVSGLAMALYRWKRPAVGPISQTVTYLFSPALVFFSIANAQIGSGPFVRILEFVLILAVATLAMGWLAARALRADRGTESALLLASTFMNVGNLGLPVTRFAFGEEALQYSVVFFVIQATMSWTLGAFIAARSNAQGLRPVLGALRLPTTWAAVAGVIVRVAGLELPTPLFRTFELLSSAAIPAMLVVLGFQLSNGTVQQVRAVAAGVGIRLLASGAVAVPLVALVGSQGVERQVMVTLAAMPTAVFTTIIATEFRANPRLVTASVVVSTVLSLLTLTVVIRVLQASQG
jgi:predicted permease